MKYQDLVQTIGKGEILPLYYLYGDEQYLVDTCVQLLLERLVTPDLRDFNLDVFYGTESRSEDIACAAATLPMFAAWRAVVVKRADALSATALEALLPCLRQPSPSTCLIFIGEKIDQRKKFFAELKKNGALVECKRLYENQLPAFVRDEVAARGKSLESVATDMLVHLVGNNLRDLVTELEKAVLFVGARDKITVADIKAIVSDTRINTVFELTDSLGGKELDRALRSLHTLLAGGEAPLLILAMVARHYRQLWKVHELLNTTSVKTEIAKGAGINPYFLEGIIRQAKNYSAAELHDIFERIFVTDLSLKTGRGKPHVLLEGLVLFLCGKG
jgi:DNA polymerase III subunit delta